MHIDRLVYRPDSSCTKSRASERVPIIFSILISWIRSTYIPTSVTVSLIDVAISVPPVQLAATGIVQTLQVTPVAVEHVATKVRGKHKMRTRRGKLSMSICH